MELIVNANNRAKRKTNGSTKLEKGDILYFIKDNPKMMTKVANNVLMYKLVKQLKKSVTDDVIILAQV